MPVVEQPLDARNCTCSLGGRNRDFMYDDGFPILEDGLPALADTWID
jgi:hypothetical protein